MIALFVLVVAVGAWFAWRSARRAAGTRPITYTTAPPARLRLHSTRKERL